VCEWVFAVAAGNVRLRTAFVGSALLLMAASSACSAHPAKAAPMALSCTVSGEKLLAPAMTGEAICAEFKRQIDAVLPQGTEVFGDVPTGKDPSWIKVAVRFVQPGTASAKLTQSSAGGVVKHPEIAIDVMDRSLNQSDVKRLATETAQAMLKAVKT
jgi:hypothetical protein